MISRKLIKIKIGKKYTTVGYRKSEFQSRKHAIEATISHLKRLLEEEWLPDATGQEAN